MSLQSSREQRVKIWFLATLTAAFLSGGVVRVGSLMRWTPGAFCAVTLGITGLVFSILILGLED